MKPEFIKDLYFRELDERHQQDSRVPTIVGVLTVLGGVLAFCFQHLMLDRTILGAVAAVGAGLAAVSYCLAVYWLLRASVGHFYERLPHAEELLAYYGQLQTYHREHPTPGESPDQDCEDALSQKMVTATTRNARTNVLRSERYYLATRYLAFTVVPLVLAGLAILSVLPSPTTNGPVDAKSKNMIISDCPRGDTR